MQSQRQWLDTDFLHFGHLVRRMGTTIALWWKRKKRGNRITAPPFCALNHCGSALCRPGAESGAEWKPLGSGRRGKCVGAGSGATRILPMEPKRSRKEKRGLRERPPLNFPRHGFLVTFLRKSRFILFLGACTFIIACLIFAMANAPFGSSFCHGTFLLLFRHFVPYGAARHPRSGKGPRLARPWLAPRWSRSKAGGGGCWSPGLDCLLRCIVCLLGLLLCACFRLFLPLLGFFTLLQLAPCFGSCLASRGHRFALGTGGLKQSLLVGGIGPVYSLPKLCFKPFRRLSAVGFVLGWHREPLLIITLQVP